MSSFSIKTLTFQNLVNKASKGASNSKFNAITSLMNVVVEGGKVFVTTTDSDSYLTVSDSVSSSDSERIEFTVNVDTLVKLISKTTAENIKITVTDDLITFVGNGTYKIPIQLDVDGSPIRYPENTLDSNQEIDASGEIKTSIIKDIVLHNKLSLATTFEAPYLTGYLCLEDKVISADTFNICINNKTLFGKKVLLPPNMFDLLTMCSEETISFKIAGNTILFESDSLKLFGHPMEGMDDYPVDTILHLDNNKYESSCTLSKSTILSVLDRLSLFIKDTDQNGAYFTFTRDGLKCESINRDGLESVPYQGSKDFKEFTCLINIDSFKKQLASRQGESFNLEYGHPDTIRITDDSVHQIMALLSTEDEDQ